MPQTLYAQFSDPAMAEKAIGALLDHGVPKERVTLLRGDGERAGKEGITTTTSGDAASGAVKGAGVGLVVGALGAVASLIIPGVGLVLGGGAVASALAAALGTAVGGALAGGVAGFLVDQGVPLSTAREYEETVREGGAVLAVDLTDEMNAPELERILAKYHGTATETATPLLEWAAGEHTIPVVEEDLLVTKRQVDLGGVRIDTRIVQEPVEHEVTLADESLVVERRPAWRDATEADWKAFEEGTIELREMTEEPVISKRTRVVEEVVIHKHVAHRTEKIRETVRRTHVATHELEGERPPLRPPAPLAEHHSAWETWKQNLASALRKVRHA